MASLPQVSYHHVLVNKGTRQRGQRPGNSLHFNTSPFSLLLLAPVIDDERERFAFTSALQGRNKSRGGDHAASLARRWLSTSAFGLCRAAASHFTHVGSQSSRHSTAMMALRHLLRLGPGTAPSRRRHSRLQEQSSVQTRRRLRGRPVFTGRVVRPCRPPRRECWGMTMAAAEFNGKVLLDLHCLFHCLFSQRPELSLFSRAACHDHRSARRVAKHP